MFLISIYICAGILLFLSSLGPGIEEYYYDILAASIIISLVSIAFHVRFSKRIGLGQKGLFLPTIIFPLGFLFVEQLPILAYVLKPNIQILYLDRVAGPSTLKRAVIVISLSSIMYVVGLTTGKLSLLLNRKTLSVKSVHFSPLKLKIGSSSSHLFAAIVFAVLIFSIQIGWRFDLVLEGGRHAARMTNSSLVTALLPASTILGYFLCVYSGLIHSIKNKKLFLLVPLIITLAPIVKFSRAIPIPLILHVMSANLARPLIKGKRGSTTHHAFSLKNLFPLVIVFVLSFIGVGTALLFRMESSGGLNSYFSLFSSMFNLESIISITSRLTEVSNLSLIGISIDRRPDVFLLGAWKWMVSILPLPSFIFSVRSYVPDVASLIGISSYGITMPVYGELYFRMGWIGLFVLFLFGYWLGKIEEKMILHQLFYRSASWSYSLIWYASLYGLMISFHSPTRRATRIIIYAMCLVYGVRFFKSCIRRKK